MLKLARAGTDSGTISRMKIWIWLAPSIRALSSNSRGRPTI